MRHTVQFNEHLLIPLIWLARFYAIYVNAKFRGSQLRKCVPQIKELSEKIYDRAQ